MKSSEKEGYLQILTEISFWSILTRPYQTKIIIFGHEYGICLASSQRVLADSEMDP